MLTREQIATRLDDEERNMATNLAAAIAPVIEQYGPDGAVLALIALAEKIQYGEFKSKRMH